MSRKEPGFILPRPAVACDPLVPSLRRTNWLPRPSPPPHDRGRSFQRARSDEEVTLWTVHDGIQAVKGEGLDAVEKRVMA